MPQNKTMTTQFIDGYPDGLRLCNCAGSFITTVYIPRSCLARARQVDIPSRGIYYLLKVDGLNIKRLYIGQTRQGIKRLNKHNQKKPWWDRAILFLSDDLNNFTLDTMSGLEKYAIEQAMSKYPTVVENKVAPKFTITKFQRPFIQSLYGEVRFMMATMGLQVNVESVHFAPAEPEPVVTKPVHAMANAEAVAVSMTRRKVTVRGLYDPKSDGLVVLQGSPIDLAAPISEKDKATGLKRKALLHLGQLMDNGDGTGILLVDVPLPSPTAAAQFAFGGSINGRKYWKVEGGKSIKEIYG